MFNLITFFEMLSSCYVFVFSTQAFAYFGSQTALSWTNGEDYCNKHCNSSLVSIHSSAENTELQDLCIILNTDKYNCWIGFTDADVDGTWIWSDGTTIDYGNDTSGGVLPWASGEPTNVINQNCIALTAGASYAWNDGYCTVAMYLLCNHCYLTLTKFILVDQYLNQTLANQYCRDMFSTELATIQSENDYQEAKLLCNYTSGCWIGLHDKNTEGVWEWEDGTQNLDFWTNSSGAVSGYPWKSGEPNDDGSGEDCVELKIAYAHLLNDEWCGRGNTFLCNSALDNYVCDINIQQELWNDISCSWTLNSKSDGCGVTSNNSNLATVCVTWLGNVSGVAYKSWTDLIIEVTFAMATMDGNSGILIRAQNVSADENGQQYYIGLFLASEEIILATIDNGFTTLASAYLNLSVAVGRYYTVRCELHGSLFYIFVDNTLLIDHYDASYTHGSVGLRSFNQTVTFKKLFISGVEYQSTRYPSKQPSAQPTRIPSKNPTTKQPSEQPTAYPTENPFKNSTTNQPTANPTKQQTLFPTQLPTNESSSYVTLDIVTIVIIFGVTIFLILVIACMVYYFLFFKKARSKAEERLQNVENIIIENKTNDNFGNYNERGGRDPYMEKSNVNLMQMIHFQNNNIQQIEIGVKMALDKNMMHEVKDIPYTKDENSFSVSVEDEDEEGNITAVDLVHNVALENDRDSVSGSIIEGQVVDDIFGRIVLETEKNANKTDSDAVEPVIMETMYI